MLPFHFAYLQHCCCTRLWWRFPCPSYTSTDWRGLMHSCPGRFRHNRYLLVRLVCFILLTCASVVLPFTPHSVLLLLCLLGCWILYLSKRDSFALVTVSYCNKTDDTNAGLPSWMHVPGCCSFSIRSTVACALWCIVIHLVCLTLFLMAIALSFPFTPHSVLLYWILYLSKIDSFALDVVSYHNKTSWHKCGLTILSACPRSLLFSCF